MADLRTNPTLSDLQTYIATLSEERGFHEENIPGKFMLLLEEAGEFAKAARKQSGIKVDENSAHYHVAEEAADVFWMLLDLCNNLDIDLEQALRDKEKKNQQREWK